VSEAPPAYVVDTNVLSNRGAAKGNPGLVRWLRRYAGLIRVSVVTMAEMRRGLILLEAKMAALAGTRAMLREQERLAQKTAWYDEVTIRFTDRLEPIDLAVAEKWAEVSVRFPSLRDADKAIAATALARGFGVATQNLGDFRQADLPLVNPFDPSTWDDDPDGDPVSSLLRR